MNTQRKRILIVEDEQDIADLIRFHLEREGFAVRVVNDGEQGLAEIRKEPPSLVILDMMLPGMSGVDVCQQLRAVPTTARLPIVMVTARAAETDRVAGLEMGADDYIVKPFSVREVVARIRSVLRRAYGEEPERAANVYEKGRLRLDMDRHECFIKGQLVALPLREFELLKFFVTSPNRVYNRLQLLDLVWGEETYVEPRTVDVHIRRLRQHIEEDDANPKLIVTVRGVGYKFDERALES